MMEAARTSETSVDNYFTRQYIPEDNSEQIMKLSHYVLIISSMSLLFMFCYIQMFWTLLSNALIYALPLQ
jgi:hypothetical protein